MNHLWSLGAIMIISLSSMGCISKMGPGGTCPGAIFGNVTYPNILNPNMDYRFNLTGEDVDFLGPVCAEGNSNNVLGIASWGDSGFGVLIEKAKEIGAADYIEKPLDKRNFIGKIRKVLDAE